MADTLRNLADARALLPDNASNLVSPQDVREYLLALEPDRGGYAYPSESGPVTLPLTQNVWLELNDTTLPGMIPPSTSVRWINDAQIRPVPAWGPDVTVPAGFLRSSRSTAILSLDPSGAANDTFELALSYGGVVDESARIPFVIDANAAIQVVPFASEHRLAMDGTQYVALTVRNTTSDGDLIVHELGLEIISRAYEEPPV